MKTVAFYLNCSYRKFMISQEHIIDINKVTSILKKSLNSNESEIADIYSFLSENNGKMIRPRLFLETSWLFIEPTQAHYEIATAFELIHLASLLHDDIIDASTLRRGKTAVWKMWNINSAVLTGDLVWCKSFELLFEHTDKKILKIILNATSKMIEGELKDNISSGKLATDINDYTHSIFNKTASLFEAICESCPLIHNKFQISNNLKNFGNNLGMAFQIMDDVKDFIVSEDKSGKPAFNDLKQQKFTLPLIVALQKSDLNEANELKKASNNHESFKNIAKKLVDKYNGVNLSRDFAKLYILKALKDLEPLKNKYKTNYLIEMAQQIAD